MATGGARSTEYFTDPKSVGLKPRVLALDGLGNMNSDWVEMFDVAHATQVDFVSDFTARETRPPSNVNIRLAEQARQTSDIGIRTGSSHFNAQ